MRIVGWHLLRLEAEARTDGLIGATLESIRFHRESSRLLIALRTRREQRHMVIGMRGPHAAFYWTPEKDRIPRFSEYTATEAFNRLRGARLESLSVPVADRIVHCDWRKTDDESAREYRLILGWTGAAANIWLMNPDDGNILELLHPGDDRRSTARSQMEIGAQFVAPDRPNLIDWRAVTRGDYLTRRRSDTAAPLAEFLARSFWGIDAPLARWVAESLERAIPHDPVADPDVMATLEYDHIVRALNAAIDASTVLTLPDDADDPGRLQIVPHTETAIDTDEPTGCLAAILALRDARRQERDARQGTVESLEKEVRKRLGEVSRRLVAAEKAIAEGEQALVCQRQADLLGANRHLLRRGMTQIALTDWSGNDIVLTFDAALSPQENIDALYRLARKVARRAETAARQLPALQTEKTKWQSLLTRLEAGVVDTGEIERLRTELGVTLPADSTTRRQQRRLPYREFTVGDQAVWVGRSSRDNDELTRRHAGPHDLFFHAQGSPGSHVILRRSSGQGVFDQRTILLAAQIAAFFSQAKHSGLVPVVYTEVRHVRKPRKAPPGTVEVRNEKSIMVRPLPPPGYHESAGGRQ